MKKGPQALPAAPFLFWPAAAACGPIPLLASSGRLRGRFLPDQPNSGNPVR
jgi:hypothetical protein